MSKVVMFSIMAFQNRKTQNCPSFEIKIWESQKGLSLQYSPNGSYMMYCSAFTISA